jgi:hypothetical protein
MIPVMSPEERLEHSRGTKMMLWCVATKFVVMASLLGLGLFGQDMSFEAKTDALGIIVVLGFASIILGAFRCYPWRRALIGMFIVFVVSTAGLALISRSLSFLV